jgi:uncharacterized protein (TIGR03435 family)
VRRESKEQTVLFLNAAKDGVKLTEVAPNEPKKPWPNQSGSPVYRISTLDGWMIYSVLNGRYYLDANKITMAEFASFIRRHVEYPVLDHTGRTGFYDLSLPLPPPRVVQLRNSQENLGRDASDPSGVDIFKSVEKLGLRLEKGKAAIENLIVDHVERVPTEN